VPSPTPALTYPSLWTYVHNHPEVVELKEDGLWDVLLRILSSAGVRDDKRSRPGSPSAESPEARQFRLQALAPGLGQVGFVRCPSFPTLDDEPAEAFLEGGANICP
jgi:hypothetical protein